MIELVDPKNQNQEKNRITKPIHQKYIKYSNFEKMYIYSCASMWIQVIVHKFTKFLMISKFNLEELTLHITH